MGRQGPAVEHQQPLLPSLTHPPICTQTATPHPTQPWCSTPPTHLSTTQALLVRKLYKAEWGEEWEPNPLLAPLRERAALLTAAEEVVDRLASEVRVVSMAHMIPTVARFLSDVSHTYPKHELDRGTVRVMMSS
jgi:hypothetical protein